MEIKGPEITTEKGIQIGLVLLGIVIVAIFLRPKTAKAEEGVSQITIKGIEPIIDPNKPLAERIKDLEARLGIQW
jgi:hypothetical protein